MNDLCQRRFILPLWVLHQDTCSEAEALKQKLWSRSLSVSGSADWRRRKISIRTRVLIRIEIASASESVEEMRKVDDIHKFAKVCHDFDIVLTSRLPVKDKKKISFFIDTSNQRYLFQFRHVLLLKLFWITIMMSAQSVESTSSSQFFIRFFVKTTRSLRIKNVLVYVDVDWICHDLFSRSVDDEWMNFPWSDSMKSKSNSRYLMLIRRDIINIEETS